MSTELGTPFEFESLWQQLSQDGHHDWGQSLQLACQQALQPDAHGLLADWWQQLSEFPAREQADWSIDDGHVVVGRAAAGQDETVREARLRQFHPWRKGPFRVGGITIDTEWRSDLKWNRIAEAVEWRNRRVLDVGCGNGYFGWRMLAAGARSVVGLDPFLLYVMQHEVIRRVAGGHVPNYVLPLADTSLTDRLQAFDVAVSMGVLYHRTSPIEHLQTLRESLRHGGQLLLETLIVDSAEETVLVPEGRYAKMRNVWFIPSPKMLLKWLHRCGFRDAEVIDITPTTSQEQRRTEWMTFESLSDFLDPQDATRTIEGAPGPVRAVITARRP